MKAHPRPSKRNGSPGGNDSPGEGERKRARHSYNAKTIKVELSFATKIPMQSIALALKGQETENTQKAVRVLDYFATTCCQAGLPACSPIIFS
ncbi:Protein argonaute 4B [Dendrobium catenatum]|uniref:Protein argonaute 4B n=1 Tax=Dendrobium catenatum TaxID=906689 RepID=A0A2I0V904_9ASPA|nr:Protein argonaute 4B [Dendrobium catenatum]